MKLETRNWKLETGKSLSISSLQPPASSPKGFALLIAVIFMSVMLAFGLALGSIGYKQQVLASYATQSQYAFYAADAALECALYADQQNNIFEYPPSAPPSAPPLSCDNHPPYSPPTFSYGATEWVVTERLTLDSDKRCADVTIYKPKTQASGVNWIFAEGYDVPCGTVGGTARYVTRGMFINY